MISSPVNLSHWHTEPFLIGGILFIGWLYAIIVAPLIFQNHTKDHFFSKSKALCFFLGLLIFYLAVGSPLDPLGENFLFFRPYDSTQYSNVYMSGLYALWCPLSFT